MRLIASRLTWAGAITVTKQPQRENSFSFLWRAYGQVAAMLGAFSLLVFLTHFYDFGLKGVVRDAFDVWTENVRPFVGHPIQWAVNLLPEAWRFEVTPIVKDYFGVSLVTLGSMMRAGFAGDEESESPAGIETILRMLATTALAMLWPIAIVLFLFVLVTDDLPEEWRQEDSANKELRDGFIARRNRFRLTMAIVLSPLIYLAGLFALNAYLA